MFKLNDSEQSSRSEIRSHVLALKPKLSPNIMSVALFLKQRQYFNSPLVNVFVKQLQSAVLHETVSKLLKSFLNLQNKLTSCSGKRISNS